MRNSKILLILTLIAIMVSACNLAAGTNPSVSTQSNIPGAESFDPITQPAIDNTYTKQEGVDVIYFAGGCFWGVEKLMQSIRGVVAATSGYANGKADIVPSYDLVVTGETGYRETVRVEYQPDQVSLDALIFAYYQVIDPTVENAQGYDVGTQYQTGIYYTGDEAKIAVERITDIVKQRYEEFVVEIKPLERFYEAEEYHQDYLVKNPMGYCHISRDEIAAITNIVVDPGDYPRPTDEAIKAMLTELQYNVTQQAGTEAAFRNDYWDNHARGLYVDIVTGEPLFSSSDKFESGTGWPSFSKGIDENAFVYLADDSFGVTRTEVRSRAGNTHLGHVFENESLSPTGTRFCINSAALRFVPYEEMEAEGYGYLLDYID